MNAHIALVLWPYWRDRTVGSRAMWRVLFPFLFILLLFIDRFYCVVVWYGFRSEGRGD